MDPSLLLTTLSLLFAALAAAGAWRPWRTRLARELLGSLTEARQEQEGRLARLQDRLDALREGLRSALFEGRQDQGARLDALHGLVGDRLRDLQASSERRLEEIRATVDERLQVTLEQRLGESFRAVSDRLAEVQEGLGRMQGLARDVGGLQRALTNVKVRGVLGEAQLGALLEQFLAPGQFEAQVRVRPGAQDVVDFAVRLPGGAEGEPVWLPIDAKFPMEDFQRLQDAAEAGVPEAVEASGLALERRLVSEARAIRAKYIAPPHTTDFAILYLPVEGLYAEALRRPGLPARLQAEHHVTLVGPTTLAAFLGSLQVGFRTLAIQRQGAEVWKVLGDVKAEFARLAHALEAVDRKLDEAKARVALAVDRNRILERRLVRVETLPGSAVDGVPEVFQPSE